ncbi:MAG: hypothetical protein OES26_20590 [Gammaproteobacteria bacterium]|nr:hypothetical protein [Gammaproteobacteria bacterium]
MNRTVCGCLTAWIFIWIVSLTPASAMAEVMPGPFVVSSQQVDNIPLSADILFTEETTSDGEEEYTRPPANRAEIYFPSAAGAVADGVFPLIVYGHGMRQRNSACAGSPDNNFDDYTQLSGVLSHLASWGFIVISADLSWLTPSVEGPGITNRMFVLRDAVQYMINEDSRVGSLFMGKIDTSRVGAMGHSMGADAAILLGASGVLGDGIGAIAAIAPPNTSEISSENINLYAPGPALLLQGTKDAFYLVFTPPTASEIYAAYDSPEAQKHLVTIHDANHFHYTEDICWTFEELFLGVLARDDQQRIARAHLAAFFRWYLKSECVAELPEYLNGSRRFEGLEAFDIDVEPGPGATAVCNEAPICDANGPYVAECTGSSTNVTLDGSGSWDPEGEPLVYQWEGPFEPSPATGVLPTVAFDELGVFTVNLEVSDVLKTARCSSTVSIEDTTPPEIGLTLSPSVLWPPNHKMVQITPVITVSDVCDASPTVALTSITTNEGEETATYDPLFDDNIGDGHTSNDIDVDDAGNIYLRAERSGAGGGRIYTITYTATDASGRSATATAHVTVPHNQ